MVEVATNVVVGAEIVVEVTMAALAELHVVLADEPAEAVAVGSVVLLVGSNPAIGAVDWAE